MTELQFALIKLPYGSKEATTSVAPSSPCYVRAIRYHFEMVDAHRIAFARLKVSAPRHFAFSLDLRSDEGVNIIEFAGNWVPIPAWTPIDLTLTPVESTEPHSGHMLLLATVICEALP